MPTMSMSAIKADIPETAHQCPLMTLYGHRAGRPGRAMPVYLCLLELLV